MMRANPWRIVTRTYGYDVKGSFRAADKRASRTEIDSYYDEIEDGRRLRECWNFHYSLYPAEFADSVLDLYGISKPPSRSRRMPE